MNGRTDGRMKGRGGKSGRLFSGDMEKEEKLRWLVNGPHSQVFGRRSNRSMAFISPLLLLSGFKEKRCFFNLKTLQTCGSYQPAMAYPFFLHPRSVLRTKKRLREMRRKRKRDREVNRGKGESGSRFNPCLPSESFSSLINDRTDGINDGKHVGLVFVFPCVRVKRSIWLMSVLTELWIYTDV